MVGVTMTQLIFMGIGTVYLLFWCIVFFQGQGQERMFYVLNEKEYPLKDLYFWGQEFLNIFHHSYQAESEIKLKKELAILYEEQYAEYYLRVVQAQRVTITSIVVAVGFIFYGVCASFTVFGVIMMMAFLAYYYYGDEIHQRIRKRSQAIMTDFSEIVSELALLSNAGMVLREAWDIVAQKGNGTIHQEMRRVVNDINNGKPEAEAYYDFGVRCILPEIKKFTSTILQGMTKGNQELGAMLQEQSGDIWKQKKQSIEQVAQEATTKLMIPMCIMFLGIIILVVVPIFANIGMS